MSTFDINQFECTSGDLKVEDVYMEKIKIEDKNYLLQLATIREVIFLLGAKEEKPLYFWTAVRTVLDSDGKLIESKGDGMNITSINFIPTEGLSYKSKFEKIDINIILIGKNLSKLEKIIVTWKDNSGKEYQEFISGRILEGLKIRVSERYKNKGVEIFNNLQNMIKEKKNQDALRTEYDELFFSDYEEYLDGVF
ncbi:hypothetical protein C671_2705 [[Clostridium] bifermentans ATCC 19299]|uniref:hypothetical protein n=1 Tax=Paraclostridium bifermentans TaxID=1490 RepID=UPI00038C819E|nr:hypothetical protein [Paraclostridium bifermentans]EQK41497.1 hypothetical protein C671_2705 [[Clostridium] bifermentans ATCC 19299] [Paraclostridium bifermentans ATCC 19299]